MPSVLSHPLRVRCVRTFRLHRLQVVAAVATPDSTGYVEILDEPRVPKTDSGVFAGRAVEKGHGSPPAAAAVSRSGNQSPETGTGSSPVRADAT